MSFCFQGNVFFFSLAASCIMSSSAMDTQTHRPHTNTLQQQGNTRERTTNVHTCLTTLCRCGREQNSGQLLRDWSVLSLLWFLPSSSCFGLWVCELSHLPPARGCCTPGCVVSSTVRPQTVGTDKHGSTRINKSSRCRDPDVLLRFICCSAVVCGGEAAEG